MLSNKLCLSCFSFLSLVVAYAASDEYFGQRIKLGTISDDEISEVSGLAKSFKFPEVLYVHNDKGDTNRIFAIDVNTGSKMATFTITGATNHDWEDLAYGPCYDDCQAGSCSSDSSGSARYCIYIADTGDHGGSGAENIIYVIREPDVIQDQDVDLLGKMAFSWSEEDAETLLIAPDGRLFIISKVNGGDGKVFALPTNQWNSAIRVSLFDSSTLQLSTGKKDPQGGALTTDGKELVLVGDTGAWFYRIPDKNYILALGSMAPHKIINYKAVDSTEAVVWDMNGDGFYTLAEGDGETIYYYPRNQIDEINVG